MIENISAVIITKNASKTISKTLESLIDFKEVVIFDSGSTDGTLDVIKTYGNVSLYSGDFLGFGETKNYGEWLKSHSSISLKIRLGLILLKHSLTKPLFLHPFSPQATQGISA